MPERKVHSYGMYPAATMRRWARSLNYFRACLSPGGHFDTGDHLCVHLRGISLAEFLAALRQSGHSVEDPGPPDSSRTLVLADMHLYFLPGNDHGFYLMMEEGRRSGWVLDDDMVKNAAAFERVLEPFADHLIDPPWEDKLRVIAPAHFPELWKD